VCTIVLDDMVNIRCLGLDPVTRRKFLAALKFMVPYARHTPQFKLKRWDGMVAFGTIGGATQLNLLDRVLPIIIEAGYEIEIDDRRPDFDITFPPIEDNELADYNWPAGHEMAGEPIMLRDYQVEAINRYFQNQQSLQCLSTGCGKTIICAAMSRKVEQVTGGRTIVVVPSKSLVTQTEEDYLTVGLDVGVFYGDRKEISCQHTICTWQSLSVFSKKTRRGELEFTINDFLEGVVCVIIDEVHGLKAQELRALLTGPMAHLPLRFGMTGTIPKEDYEFLALLSCIGPVVGEICAVDLMEKGVLADCDIRIVQLLDDHVGFSDYESEHNFLVTDPDRVQWIANYCINLADGGNTLILVDRKETGFMLEAAIQDAVFICGDVKVKNRKKEYDLIKTSKNKVIIATYGVAAVGINVPRMFNLVLLECGRSFVRTIQSAGRVLRRSKDKNRAVIVDMTSSLKYSRRHLSKRKEYYRDAGYPFTVAKVDYRCVITPKRFPLQIT